MRPMKRMLLLLMALLLMAPAALAEDVYTVKDGLSAAAVTTDKAYLSVRCQLPEAGTVILTVRDEWGYLVYQRDYGVKTGSFRSGDVFLPLEGESSRYAVTLETAGGSNTFTVIREMAMLTDSSVYAGGLTMKELADGSRYKYALVLDMDALNEETIAVPMLAGGMQVGEVVFTVLDGTLTVSAALLADGVIDKANVYVAADALTARTLGTNRFGGLKTRLNREIDLGDAPYAAVMVQLTVTYDPATALAYEPAREEREALEQMLEDWQLMQLLTANEAVG